MIGGHPRLLLRKGEERNLLETFQKYPELQEIHQRILRQCERYLKEPVQYYHQEGHRLHAGYKSSDYIFYLSYAYRMTKEKNI